MIIQYIMDVRFIGWYSNYCHGVLFSQGKRGYSESYIAVLGGTTVPHRSAHDLGLINYRQGRPAVVDVNYSNKEVLCLSSALV